MARQEANGDLGGAERKLQTAVSEQAHEMQSAAAAEVYREAIAQYRAAIQISADVSRVLRRTLETCATCERRCPGLPACDLGR